VSCGSSRSGLNAGVLEDGKRIRMEKGTSRAAVLRRDGQYLSPLRCSICGVRHGRRKRAQGEVIAGGRYGRRISVVGVLERADAKRFPDELTEPFRSSNLNCIPYKTRFWSSADTRLLTESGSGQGNLETFDFLALRIFAEEEKQRIFHGVAADNS